MPIGNIEGWAGWQKVVLGGVIAGIFAIIAAFIGGWIQFPNVNINNNQNITIDNPLKGEVVTSITRCQSPAESQVKARQIISIIQNLQRDKVKESWGELAYQAFTDDDLDKFYRDKVTDSIKQGLSKDNNFQEVVAAIGCLSPDSRLVLLTEAKKPLHRTWAEMGKISREGQTDAGQTAELVIASAVVELVELKRNR